jgi:hypothetical protein
LLHPWFGRPGISPRIKVAKSSVKAGLKVRSGSTREASSRLSALVESRVAAQLRTLEASRAATKRLSICGTCTVQEKENPALPAVSEHWVSRSAPAARMGNEAAFVIQARGAGRTSRRMGLLRMGSNEVKSVATSARNADMMSLCGGYKQTYRSSHCITFCCAVWNREETSPLKYVEQRVCFS